MKNPRLPPRRQPLYLPASVVEASKMRLVLLTVELGKQTQLSGKVAATESLPPEFFTELLRSPAIPDEHNHCALLLLLLSCRNR